MAMDRVIALVDMDCFYVQVEQRRNPELKGKPCAVVQYNAWKGGGIIAVGYEARARGVTRGGMRGDEAKEICPEIALVRVPENRGKADLTRYREAGAEVIEVLCKFSKSVEKASVDEAYIDLTDEVHRKMEELGNERVSADMLPNTHVADWRIGDENGGQKNESAQDERVAGLFHWLDSYGNTDDKRLAVGGLIAEEMRAAVFQETGFRCSAGVAYNKMLAKLACGLHKPNQQTVLPHRSVEKIYQTMPIRKVRHFGGKLGQQLQDELGMQYMSDITKATLNHLQSQLGDKLGAWLYEVGRGIEHEPVRPRQLSKSVGCGKNFPGKNALATKQQVKHWLLQLASEIEERLQRELDTNKRTARLMTVNIRTVGTPPQSMSRSFKLHNTSAETVANNALAVMQCFNAAGIHQEAWSPPILTLNLAASKFNDPAESTSSASISNFFTSDAAGSSDSDRLAETTQSRRGSTGVKTGQGKKNKRSSIESFFGPSQKKRLVEVRENYVISVKENTTSSCTDNSTDDKMAICSNSSDGRMGFFATKDKSQVTLQDEKLFVDSASRQKDVEDEVVFVFESRDSEHDVDMIDFKGSSNFKSNPASNLPCTSRVRDTPGTEQNINKGVRAESEQQPQCQGTQNDRAEDVPRDTDVVMCDKCSKMISVWDLPEHLDFHFAMDVQAQINSTAAQPLMGASDIAPPAAAVGKKHPVSGKNVGQPLKKKSKPSNSSTCTLDQFFQKKTDQK